MIYIVITLGLTDAENFYYGPFDSEKAAREYARSTNIDDYLIGLLEKP